MIYWKDSNYLTGNNSKKISYVMRSDSVPFVKFILTLLGTFLPVTVFYFLDKRFNLKAKLVKQFKRLRTYKITLLVSGMILYVVYISVLYALGSSMFFTGFAIIFLYQYLIFKPERCLNSEE